MEIQEQTVRMGGKQGKAKKILKLIISWLLFIGYLVVLSYFLFFSEYYGRTEISLEYRYNLKLFTEIRRFIVYRKTLGMQTVIVNLIGNVAAFMPLGIILPVLNQKNARFLRILVLSMFFSGLIEFLQLVYHVGIFDVDDIFLNTCGAVLGYFVYLLCRQPEDRR